MKQKIYKYYYSFWADGKRIRAHREAPNIHEIIRLTRREYRGAASFIVIDKRGK